MSSGSPDVVLYDSQGNMLAVQDGVVIPVSTPALLIAGSDGYNSRYITLDGYGHQVVVGAGSSGIPSGGVITIQGTIGGTNVPVSQGTIPWLVNDGYVTIGNPTYIPGTTNYLSLDTSGNLRVTGSFNTNVDGYATTSIPSYINNTSNPFSLTTVGLLRSQDILESFSQYQNKSITTTPSEALGGATILSHRKVISVTPIDGYVYWGTDNLVTPLTGPPIFKNQTFTISASSNLHVWLIAATGTVNCRIVEAG